MIDKVLEKGLWVPQETQSKDGNGQMVHLLAV